MLAKAPSPRNRLNTLRPFRGVMRFSPETLEFLVFRMALGEKSESGFISIEEDPGNYSPGVIYLKDAEEPGYYLVNSIDLFRRRINAKPSNRLDRDAALRFLGVDPASFPDSDSADVSTTAAVEPGSGEGATPEELQAIELLVKEQEGSLLDLEAAKAS